MMPAARQRGFTLVELVVTLTLSAIVAGFIAMSMATPVQAYLAQSRRAELADSADAIVRNIDADIRNAVPNDIRLASNGSVAALEVLVAEDVLRYLSQNESGNPASDLNTQTADTQFSTLDRLGRLSERFQSSTYALVINNVITPPNTAIDINWNPNTSEDDVTLNPGFQFGVDSPTHSVFVVSGAVTYLCDLSTRTLRRYTGYPIANSIAPHDTPQEMNNLGATSSLIAHNVTACGFNGTPGNYSAAARTQRFADLVRLRVTLSSNGETFPLFHQARVERVP